MDYIMIKVQAIRFARLFRLKSFTPLCLALVYLSGCGLELEVRNNPLDSEALAENVCPADKPDCVRDCAGHWNGEATLDVCGICVGGNTGLSECFCGDGIINGSVGEECDDADNNADTNACLSDCTIAICGDGQVQGIEQCDDGTFQGTGYCASDCTGITGSCGDGEVQGGVEECDDGNNQDLDYCAADCNEATGSCGDGEVQSGVEQCDDGTFQGTGYCASDCTGIAGSCGDGEVQIGVEQCDDGTFQGTGYCASDCTAITGSCGDGEVQIGVEQCDDLNTQANDYCSSDCMEITGSCGDGVVQGGVEECDDGNADNTDSCATWCASVPEDMVPVPSGDFWMGCNSAVDYYCSSDESPYHEVYLDGFFIDITEVTAGDYKECVLGGDCNYDGSTSSSYRTYNNNRDDHPINFVNYFEAKTYCEAQGKRLPTEAEWEKAARGTDGWTHPWGNSPEANCVYVAMYSSDWGCGTGETLEVGIQSYGVSPYGAHDMLGNVWEWTADWYSSSYYEETQAGGWVNPEGPLNGVSRVLRGGSFSDFYGSGYLRASYRGLNNPGNRDGLDGFRCAQ